MILQDPMASLNPLFSIYRQVAEPAYYHQGIRGRSLRQRVQDLLRAVRIPSPAVRMRDYPHQMSGGMRQRIVGAIAMAGGPKLIIADEPTTNLDVTIQAQYLDLLKDIQQESRRRDDLRHPQPRHRRQDVRPDGGDVCRQDRRARRGARPVQRGRSIPTPRPCSARCQSSAARSRSTRSRASRPISRSLPPGCAFHPRCPDAMPRCAIEEPMERGSARIGRRDAGSLPLGRQRRHMTAPVLEVQGLQKYFPVSTGSLLQRRDRLGEGGRDGVDFAICPARRSG